MAGTLLYAKDGSALVKQAGSAFEEAVNRGNVYGGANQTGVTSQAGLSATTPVLTLYNPAGSGKKGVLWFAGTAFTVAFATAGAVWLAQGGSLEAAAVTGTLSTAHRNLLTGRADGNKIRLLTVATLPAAPVGIALLGAGLTGAITTLPYAVALERWFNGAYVLKPGYNFTIQTGVASGASGMFCEFIWEEIDE